MQTKTERTNLKTLRTKHHLSQTEIAEKLGCGRATYSAIEKGTRHGRQYFWNEVQRVFELTDAEMWELMKIETYTKP